MNIQNNRHPVMSELLSDFQEGNLQVPKTLVGHLFEFIQNLELLNDFTPHLKSVLNTKTIHYEQIEEFNQDFTEIKTILLKIKAIHDKNGQFFTKISNIVDASSNLIIRNNYLSNLTTSSWGSHVKNKAFSYFYTITHQNLVDLLINLKYLTKPMASDDIDLQNSIICQKIKDLIDVLPFIKEEYIPNALYSKVPDSIKRLALLGENLNELTQSYIPLVKSEFLIAHLKRVIKDFTQIQKNFNENPNVKLIRLKRKFKITLLKLSDMLRIIQLSSPSKETKRFVEKKYYPKQGV